MPCFDPKGKAGLRLHGATTRRTKNHPASPHLCAISCHYPTPHLSRDNNPVQFHQPRIQRPHSFERPAERGNHAHRHTITITGWHRRLTLAYFLLPRASGGGVCATDGGGLSSSPPHRTPTRGPPQPRHVANPHLQSTRHHPRPTRRTHPERPVPAHHRPHQKRPRRPPRGHPRGTPNPIPRRTPRCHPRHHRSQPLLHSVCWGGGCRRRSERASPTIIQLRHRPSSRHQRKSHRNTPQSNQHHPRQHQTRSCTIYIS